MWFTYQPVKPLQAESPPYWRGFMHCAGENTYRAAANPHTIALGHIFAASSATCSVRGVPMPRKRKSTAEYCSQISRYSESFRNPENTFRTLQCRDSRSIHRSGFCFSRCTSNQQRGVPGHIWRFKKCAKSFGHVTSFGHSDSEKSRRPDDGHAIGSYHTRFVQTLPQQGIFPGKVVNMRIQAKHGSGLQGLT